MKIMVFLITVTFKPTNVYSLLPGPLKTTKFGSTKKHTMASVEIGSVSCCIMKLTVTRASILYLKKSSF